MNLLELKDKIKSHLVAGYPGLFIHSGEEARVDTMLQDIAAQLRLHPKEWNLGYGWVDFFNKQPRGSQGSDNELASSLPTLLDDDLDGKLFIIKDARSALEHQPLAVARLKQLLNRIQRHHRGTAAVVLVSETLHIPPQIEAQITLLPLPLPRGDEISEQIDKVCRERELLVPEPLRQRLHAACSGLSQEEIRSALAMVRLQHEQINDAALALIQREKEQIIAKSGVLEMLRASENATDIGGLENLKKWLDRRAQIFRRLGEAREARVQAPKGVLIAGMPGCGKSLTAKAAAGLFQLPLLRLDIGLLLGKYVGESEHNMRRALTMAESVSPCILWIDELEKAFVGMTSGSGSEVSSRLFGYFLTWMQEKTGAVFVIATANNVAALPPELLRKGRFDEVFYVGFPNATERGAILDIHLKGEALELQDEQVRRLVSQCRDYAGADIQNAINEAREAAFLDNRALRLEDLEAAIESTVPLRETLREQVAEYEEIFEKLKLKPASACDGLSVAQMIQMAESANALRREEVARNEDCPDDLLEKLAADPVEDIRDAVYRNPNCPERVLTLRINIDEDDADFDRELLHLACVHPHAPQDLLASQFQWLGLKPEHRRQLAMKSSHEPLLRQLLTDKDVEVRRTLAHSRHLGADGQRQLSKDTDDSVRLALAGNSALSGEVQSLLSRDRSEDVRETLAKLPTLNETAQLSMVRDDDIEVLLALASREGDAHLPESVQLELARSAPDVRLQLAGNTATSAPAQLLLAQDAHTEVRKVLAHHPALSGATVQYLTKDVEVVQIALAGNDGLSPLQLRALVQHESGDVRSALADNESAGLEILALLSRDRLPVVREKVASNGGIDAQIVDCLLCDGHAEVRETMLLWHNELSAEQQQRMLRDPQSSVRERFAWYNATGDDIHEQLLADNAKVREELARNASIGTSIQQRLARASEPEVRLALAQNTSLGAEVQALLAEDDDVEVRAHLAANDELTPEVFAVLLKDVEKVQCELALHRHLTQEQYGHLARSGFDKVRWTLAQNSHIGEDMMRQLAQHAVATTEGTSWSVQQAPSKLMRTLACNRTLPESLQHELHENWSHSKALMSCLAGTPALVPALQMKLAKHADTDVRAKLAVNPRLVAEVVSMLMKDSSSDIRSALVRSQVLDADIEEDLCNERHSSARRHLVANPHTRKRTQVALAMDHDQDLRRELLTNANGRRSGFALKLAAQALLIQDNDEDIRVLLAQHPQLSLALQNRLAEDEESCVRKALAGQPSSLSGRALSEEVQLRLLKDPDTSVRAALAGNTQLLPHVQLALARDSATHVRTELIRQCSTYGARLLMVAQKSLANDASLDVRIALADALFGNYPPATSEEILLTLAGDSEHRVKETIVRCLSYSEQRFSDAVMARLKEGLDEETRETLEEVLASCEED